MRSISDDIRDKALELGFHKVGFAKVEPLFKEGEKFQDWLSHGYHGTMSWLEKNTENRINPQKILPDAKSVISVAMNYYKDDANIHNSSIGKISRYALGGDYHVVLKTRLNRLLEYIKDIEPLVKGKIFVDSGDIMEKVWMVRSGIGWRGKHSITVTKEYGSWVFLGEIVLNLELEYDRPATDLCGDCRKCIDACPTKAIIKPYVLEANRCIAYLTIEHKGKIPSELSEKNNNWIFGCDICQEVCPWNQKKAKMTDVKEFFPNEDYYSLKLESLIKLTQRDFDRLFRDSPIKRTGLSKLKRNVRVILENK
ncbi:MAG: tRNA epoxyqueuosine(34) reductase QueG [Ignavibacteriales bacterium]|nr:tRNA epoxyqueuosine(34) reductase QueG [Ignavibacteriales bacterium]